MDKNTLPLRPKEVATLLRCSPAKVWRLVGAGHLRSIKIGPKTTLIHGAQALAEHGIADVPGIDAMGESLNKIGGSP